MSAEDKVREWHRQKTGPLTPHGYISVADAAIAALEAELAEARLCQKILRAAKSNHRQARERAEQELDETKANLRDEKRSHERTTYLLGALSIWAKGLNGTAEDALSAARHDWNAREDAK